MDLDNRLQTAQTLNELLKKDSVVKFGNKKVDEKIEQEIEGYVKKHLHNLLLTVMGERSTAEFSEEEVTILKTMVQRIKNPNTNIGAKA